MAVTVITFGIYEISQTQKKIAVTLAQLVELQAKHLQLSMEKRMEGKVDEAAHAQYHNDEPVTESDYE